MRTPLCILPLCAAFLVGGAALAKEQAVVGEDDASHGAYSGGWGNGKNGGTGFGEWTLQTYQLADKQSHAGGFIASTDNNADLNGIAIKKKAFGLFANGEGFENAVAFRAFERPLKVGQSFSFTFEHGVITKKFDRDDPTPGSVGLVLRSGNANSSVDDYNKDSRFEFGYFKENNGYRIYDSENGAKVDLPFSDSGFSVTFTLVTADTYDFEATVLATKKTVKLSGRKLGGTPGAPLTSFAFYNRNGEANDVFFNGFQISQPAE